MIRDVDGGIIKRVGAGGTIFVVKIVFVAQGIVPVVESSARGPIQARWLFGARVRDGRKQSQWAVGTSSIPDSSVQIRQTGWAAVR